MVAIAPPISSDVPEAFERPPAKYEIKYMIYAVPIIADINSNLLLLI
jgi:hypothetical protein